jgi:ribulose-5-phosphate 4-epimerase/fuculose-1-phosphate aldolase
LSAESGVAVEALKPGSLSQVAELVDANHILFDQGVLDAFGHVSVRSEQDPQRFLLARNLAPALVSEEDILQFTLQGDTEDSRPPYLERFIHGEIYRARPDVVAVVHSHSPAVVPFSVSNVPLRAVMHMAGFLAEGAPVFEIRDVAGTGSDVLVRNRESGEALARVLGSGSVVLMRGHGSVAVGASLREAVYRAVYTEVNARAQASALALGACTYLTSDEGVATVETMSGQLHRAWGIWRTRARGSRGPLPDSVPL